MSVSQLACEIKESPTLAMNDKARILREKGEKVIHLGAGEPKDKVPVDAVLAAAAKLSTADVRYTPTRGIPALIKAIIEYTEKNYGKTVDKTNIIVSNGAKHSLYNLLMAIINPQDEVIMLAPYWVSYPEIIKMVYGVPVTVTPEAVSLEPTIEEISAKTGSKTKAIIVNSPNNPSGAVYSAEFIGQLVEFCESKGIYLVMDDIYHKLIFDGQTAPSVFKYSKKDMDSSYMIIVNGVSKVYAMTGFRVGWVVANKKVTDAMINIQAQNSSCTSVVVQAAAAGALNGNQSSVESMRLTLQNNRDVMLNELNTLGGVQTNKPGGTFYSFPNFRAYSNDSVALSNFLLEKALVVTVPGAEFGLEGYLRLSYCGSINEIVEGVARIKWALDPESPEEIYIGDRKMRRDWK